jgi:hypothetical protein
MLVELNNLIFETAEGTWRSEYIGEPGEPYDSDRVNYHLSFKWIDQNNPENRVTPERRLRLVTYHSQSSYGDYEEKLKKAIQLWLDSTEEIEAAYIYPSLMLQSTDR